MFHPAPLYLLFLLIPFRIQLTMYIVYEQTGLPKALPLPSAFRLLPLPLPLLCYLHVMHVLLLKELYQDIPIIPHYQYLMYNHNAGIHSSYISRCIQDLSHICFKHNFLYLEDKLRITKNLNFCLNVRKRNEVFATNSNFPIHISLQHDGVSL